METRHYIITLLLVILPIAVLSQELKVQSFALSPTEIIPSNEQRKDLNGVNCALVKIQVVDGIDRVEGNIIGDIDSRGTEKRIYLTQGTKTFRLYPHSHLSVTITTSEFDIEKLESNRVYILRLTGGADEKKVELKKEKKQEPVRQQQTEIYQDQTSGYSDYYYQQQTSKPAKTSYFSDAEFHFYAGLGFNAISLMGPSVQLGISYGMFSLEGGFAYGIDKVENISFTLKGSSAISEAYDYSCSKAWARLGVSFDMEQFRITPQTGITFNMISGKTANGAFNTTDYFKDANPMSAFAAVRLSYEVIENLRIYLTPQYDFSIGGDEIFEVIKQGDSKIKAWGEGFGINAGIIYEF
jgi:hypothetical protein